MTIPASPFTLAVKVHLEAIAIPDPDGRLSLIVTALPGCVSQADSVEEAQANVVEAAEAWLAVAHEQNRAEVNR